MKTSQRFFYSRLAIDGMKKNRQLYLPFLLSGIMMTAMFYILSFLNVSSVMKDMLGGGSASVIVKLGAYVVGIFAVLFLFYTHSFLIRRRKKEYGLYHILGMNKKNLGRIFFLETLIGFIIVIVVGLICGILLSKLAELGFARVIEGGINCTFSVPLRSLVMTIAIFAGIFLLLFFNGLLQIHKTDAIVLLRSENLGEKPPKANWILGLLGIGFLAGAYVIALRIQQPISAFTIFFVAVIMVILGTYLFFIAGSVLLCKILQKNKKYYYQANHFVSVSSMSYRMKRNGAGLASICILLTMVLVIISSAFTLYCGREECLFARYPREQNAFACSYGYTKDDGEWIERLNQTTQQILDQKGIQAQNRVNYHDYLIAGYLENSELQIVLNSGSDLTFIDYEKVGNVQFIDLEDYNRLFGKQETLKEGEAFAYINKAKDIGKDFKVGEKTFHIVKDVPELKDLKLDGTSDTDIMPSILLVVKDSDSVVQAYKDYLDVDGTPLLCLRWFDHFDTGLDEAVQNQLDDELDAAVHACGVTIQAEKGIGVANMYCSYRDEERKDFVHTFGGMFFLGIMLTIVFLMASVMIIYYKQISEGYEDQARFDMMQKVGMTKKDITKTINSQMLTVFFAPIFFAAMHLAFAFPMIRKILMIFGLFNTPLYIMTTAGTVLIIAVFYTLVYKITSRAYFHIVTAAKR